MTERVTIDLTKNHKQYDYFVEVVKSCKGLNNYRKFAYGGAIRGGKTFITLWILIWLCRNYPLSKWVCVRNDFPNLQKTAIESFQKIIMTSKNWKWNRDRGNFYVEYKNGSRIYFMGENITHDPDLNDFLGLECNGFFIEQLEEISEKTWQIAASRSGSWYIDPMPPAFLFTTFNPTQRWPKKHFYEANKDGTLPPDHYYMNALPTDNAYVTQDQWNTWGQMTPRYQKQFIEGDWTDFDDTDPRWLYGFEEKHISDTVEFMPNYPICLCWDFNLEPLSCVVMQMSPQIGGAHAFLHFIDEFYGDVQLQELCTQIKAKYPASIMFITGDSSGNKGDVGYDNKNETHYKMIARFLNISEKNLHLNRRNLEHHDSRLLINTMLHNYPNIKYSKSGCPQLIHECRFAKVDITKPKGGALKKDRDDHKLDLFDGHRYAYQQYFKEYVDKVWLNIK